MASVLALGFASGGCSDDAVLGSGTGGSGGSGASASGGSAGSATGGSGGSGGSSCSVCPPLTGAWNDLQGPRGGSYELDNQSNRYLAWIWGPRAGVFTSEDGDSFADHGYPPGETSIPASVGATTSSVYVLKSSGELYRGQNGEWSQLELPTGAEVGLHVFGDGTELYLSLASGLYVYDETLSSWSKLTDEFVGAMSYSNGDVRLARLGIFGSSPGLSRSTDGGKSWVVDMTVPDVPVHLQATPLGIALFSESGVWFSSNQGETWSELRDGTDLRGGVYEGKIVVQDGGELFAYDDAGGWQSLGPTTGLDYTTELRALGDSIVGSVSLDGLFGYAPGAADHWKLVSPRYLDSEYFVAEPGRQAVSGYHFSYCRSDSSAWARCVGPVRASAVLTTAEQSYAATNEAVFSRTPGSDAWTVVATLPPGNELSGPSTLASGEQGLFAGMNVFVHSGDGKGSPPLPVGGGLYQLDGGGWSALHGALPKHVETGGVVPTAVDALLADAGVLYAVARGHGVYRSENGGAAWEKLPASGIDFVDSSSNIVPVPQGASIAKAKGRLVIALWNVDSASDVLARLDESNTLVPLPLPDGVEGKASALAASNDVLYVGTTKGEVLVSTSGGDTWSDLGSIGKGRVGRIQVLGDKLIVGTTEGLYELEP